MAGKSKSGKKISAGILMYRFIHENAEVLLVHPGGPYFAKKDEGHWSIPKGEPDDGEDLLAAAKREFEEETGLKAEGEFIELGSIIQKGGKEVHGWGVKGDKPENHNHTANLVKIEWPLRSGKKISFPEVDKAEFFSIDEAKKKIKEAQIPLIERLEEYLISL
jgi:predicted NUDIX family NTP pyrophosphohydrolase